MNNYDYPEGSDNSSAPWNREEPESKEATLEVTITLSKRFIVDLYPDDDIVNKITESFVTPDNLSVFIKRMFEHDLDLRKAGMPMYLRNALRDCEGWKTEDFEVNEV